MEYIEREAVKEKFERLRDKCGNNDMAFALNWAVSLTGKIPAADVVPVVRCCECKHRHDDNFCGGRGWPAHLVPDDGYCDRGVRKDGDGDA